MRLRVCVCCSLVAGGVLLVRWLTVLVCTWTSAPLSPPISSALILPLLPAPLPVVFLSVGSFGTLVKMQA